MTNPSVDAEARVPAPSKAVQGALAGCAAILLMFCAVAARGGLVRNLLELGGITLLLMIPVVVPALLWHEKKAPVWRDAALMLPWGILMVSLLKAAILTATARAFPLRDDLWQRWDQHLGIDVPLIVDWAARHSAAAHLLMHCYTLLAPMMMAAFLAPALLGRRKAAERFVLGNALGYVLALPCILLLPAVGPWVAWHFTPTTVQHTWEVGFRGVREGNFGSDTSLIASVCLPSFHAFWAVLSAQALGTFRWVRIPAILLAVLVVISTLTTGWHYGVDVLAGLVLAGISMVLAAVVTKGQ